MFGVELPKDCICCFATALAGWVSVQDRKTPFRSGARAFPGSSKSTKPQLNGKGNTLTPSRLSGTLKNSRLNSIGSVWDTTEGMYILE